MNSQHLRLKWHFEKLDKYGPSSAYKAIESLQKCRLNRTIHLGFFMNPVLTVSGGTEISQISLKISSFVF